MTNNVDRGPTDVEQVIAGQRRHRRLRFWLGFAVIALLGGLWAGLTTDPLGPGIFGGEDVIFDAPAAEVAEFEDFDVPTTTEAPAPVPPETTGPPSTATTTGPSTSLVTTTGP